MEDERYVVRNTCQIVDTQLRKVQPWDYTTIDFTNAVRILGQYW